jgi:archaellum biogenesis ATPase FlaH
MTNNKNSNAQTPSFGGQGGYDKWFIPAFAEGYIEPDFDFKKNTINSIDLLKNEDSENRYLLSPFLPRVGTGILAGAPDTGKSQFARQLCIAVATQMNHFLDYGLSATHNRALYIATEDDAANTNFLLEHQLKGLYQKPTSNLNFIFADTLGQHEILLAMDEHLKTTPCDLVIVDSFGDIFIGADGNNNQAMRKNVRSFQYFALKHQCLILFVHHINKAAYKLSPNQAHIQGGGGLTQKVRIALQLSQGESDIKYLTVVKGNYCPRQFKQNAMELTFDEKKFLFTRTGKEIPIDLLNTEENKTTQLDKLQETAEGIFEKSSLSYKDYCTRHNNITGKSFGSAKRDHASMKQLEIIVKDGRKWKLA